MSDGQVLTSKQIYAIGSEITSDMLKELEILLARSYGRSNFYYKDASKFFDENFQLKKILGIEIDSENPILKANK